MEQYKLSKYEADILVGDKALADYFEEVVGFGIRTKEVANWMLADLLRVLKENKGDGIPVKSQYFADLIKMVEEGKISRSAGKEV